MCGIAGIFKSDGLFTFSDVEAVLRMMDAQTHRGPDDWGLLLPHTAYANDEVRQLLKERGLSSEIEIGNPKFEILNSPDSHIRVYKAGESRPAVILGSRRLSILDLSPRGRMPMSTCDETLWLTHNGEIYNCVDLREQLRKDFSFQSHTDTEVILNGYARWGDEVLEHLRGMFAFALFDAARSRLLLARDRFGIKPLYYAKTSGCELQSSDFSSAVEASNPQSAIRNSRLVFASEVRAILKSGLADFELEPEAIVRFLQLGSVPAPLTTIKNVFALPSAHSLIAEGSGTVLSPYWELSHSTQESREENQTNAIETTRRLLDESVRQHLLSDVPLGVFLSGGVDSSALVALARKFTEQPLKTLSIVFDEPEYNEAKYARLVADHYRTEHHETLLKGTEVLFELPQVFSAMDQPTIDGVNSFFISRAAKQAGLKVVLSGLGGDEVFLGYDHLRKAESLNRWPRLFSKLPQALRRVLIDLAVPAGPLLGRTRLEKLKYLQDPSNEGLYLMFRGLFTPWQIQKLLGLGDAEMKRYGILPQGINGSKGGSLTDSFVVNDFRHYLQNQLLKDTDCMSMAHSIEARVPFLDHELVSYVLGLPSEFKLDAAINKPLLIAALRDDFPREVWDRPKMGFTFPFALWLRGSMEKFKPDASQANGAGILDRRESEKIWQGFREHRFHWSRPWALTILENFTA